MPGSLPTIMETTQSFAFVSGQTYSLTFDFPTGTQADPLTFTFGPVLEQLYDGYAFPLTDTITASASSSGTASIGIALGSATNTNFGPYLTSISLTESYDDDAGTPPPAPVPLPATALLLGGALGLLALRRRTA